MAYPQRKKSNGASQAPPDGGMSVWCGPSHRNSTPFVDPCLPLRRLQKTNRQRIFLNHNGPKRRVCLHRRRDQRRASARRSSPLFLQIMLNFVFSEIEGAEFRVNLRTSVLDDAASFPPFVEVMVDQKLPWADVQAQHSFGGLPGIP